MKKKTTLFLNRILLTSYVISLFSEGIILPIYAIFVQGIGGDILDAGLAIGIFLISEGIFTFLIHRTKRDYNKQLKLMVLGWFVWLIGIGFYLIISDKWTLFIAQIFLALGNALADPIYDEEYASNTKRNTSEKEWGIFEGSQAFVNGFAAIAGGFLVSLFGFRILIYVMVITATISFILVWYYVSKIRKVKKYNNRT